VLGGLDRGCEGKGVGEFVLTADCVMGDWIEGGKGSDGEIVC